MTLIKSISGIRGTIGGEPGKNLTPVDIVKFTAAFGSWIINRHQGRINMVTGRDGRRSGPMIGNLVISTLRNLGINVTDLGMASTPTVELAVAGTGAQGGIVITASHNPAEWNALKLLNEKGEFLSAKDGEEVLNLASGDKYTFASADKEGSLVSDNSWDEKHIGMILSLPGVEPEMISKAGFTIAIDCINSVGGKILPHLLNSLGVKKVIGMNIVADGNFAHNPEPLPGNLKDISNLVVREKADAGFAVDPDVDRLAIISEDGSMFGEEYTLVAVSDYILGRTPGNTVSNMSSSMALKDISEKHGCRYFSSTVGEVNVVEEMKNRRAVIGGEGNGGVIFPALHYGRDALVAIALFLTHLAAYGKSCSSLRKQYPNYHIAKKKLTLGPSDDFSIILNRVKHEFREFDTDERDGIKINFPGSWVQIRKSNTESIMRIYAEADTEVNANNLADRIIDIVKKI